MNETVHDTLFNSLFKTKCCFVLLTLMSLIWSQPSFSGGIAVYEFESEQERAQFNSIIDELRCPKCKNQSVADSDAPIAIDIRDRVYQQLQDGASRDEIVQYMVDRYGQFVNYRPPLTASTLLLWFGPPLLVVLIMIIVFWRRAHATTPAELTQTESAQVDALLATYDMARAPDPAGAANTSTESQAPKNSGET